MNFQVSRESTGVPGDIKPLHIQTDSVPTYSFLSKYVSVHLGKRHYDCTVTMYFLQPRSSADTLLPINSQSLPSCALNLTDNVLVSLHLGSPLYSLPPAPSIKTYLIQHHPLLGHLELDGGKDGEGRGRRDSAEWKVGAATASRGRSWCNDSDCISTVYLKWISYLRKRCCKL